MQTIRKNRNWIAVVCLFSLVASIGVSQFDPQKANAQTSPSASAQKSAIINKAAIPSASTYTTLTTLCGRTSPFLFRGYIAFDSGNAGASDVMKSTVANGTDVPATAGSFAKFSAVDSDSIQIKGAVTDYVNIVGEDVARFSQGGLN